MNLQPLRDRILVKPIDRVKSDILAVVMSENPNIGEIVAIGPGKRDKKGRVVPLVVKPGDRIRFGDTTQNHLSFPEWRDENGEKFLLMKEADVCWVMDDELSVA